MTIADEMQFKNISGHVSKYKCQILEMYTYKYTYIHIRINMHILICVYMKSVKSHYLW